MQTRVSPLSATINLNLPDSVVIAGKGYIRYRYTASGAKLRKEVYELGKVVVATDYAGLFVHQGDTLFAHTTEGRVLYQPQADEPWRYEYHLKDHLGNLRVSFAEATSSTTGASMEPMMAGLPVAISIARRASPSPSKRTSVGNSHWPSADR